MTTQMTTGAGPPPFRTGDIVRLRTGTSPQKVLEVDYKKSYRRREFCWAVRCVYLSSEKHPSGYYDRYGTQNKWRVADDFVLHEQWQDPPKPKEPEMPKLYQTKPEKNKEVRYGTFLTKDSKGRLVLEMKPDGVVQAFKASELDEVLPYTVELTQVKRQESDDPRSMHVLAVEGQVERDDMMLELASGLLWRVTNLNSKCRRPKENKSRWMKIPAEYVEFGEVEPTD